MIMEAGDILLRRGLITADQLERARISAGNISSSLEQAIQQGMVKEDEALRAVAEEVGLDFIDLRTADVDLSLLQSFPQKLIYRHALFPLKRQNGSLLVATADPLDLYPIDEASAATGLSIIPVVAERVEIAKLVKKHLGVGSETVEGLMAARAEDDDSELLEHIESDGGE